MDMFSSMYYNSDHPKFTLHISKRCWSQCTVLGANHYCKHLNMYVQNVTKLPEAIYSASLRNRIGYCCLYISCLEQKHST